MDRLHTGNGFTTFAFQVACRPAMLCLGAFVPQRMRRNQTPKGVRMSGVCLLCAPGPGSGARAFPLTAGCQMAFSEAIVSAAWERSGGGGVPQRASRSRRAVPSFAVVVPARI